MRVRIVTMTMTILLLALAGCTESTSDSPPSAGSLTADQLYDQAMDNASAQPSFHLIGLRPDDVRLDVWSDGSRSLVIADLDGERGEVRRDGQDVVARGSARFFALVYAGDGGAELFSHAGPDRWVGHQTNDPRYAVIKRLFDLRLMLQLVAPLTRDDPRDGSVALHDAIGGVLTVSITGPPLPIRIVRGPTRSDISYGEAVSVTMPEPTEIIPAPANHRP
jgi:hypothetical protein